MNDWTKILCAAWIATAAGCAPRTEPIERKVDDGLALLKTALEKAGEELSSQSASLIGSGAVIEPGYKIRIWGGLFNGFLGETEIRVVGASAQLGAATQMGPPNRNVESFGESKLPPTEPTEPTEPTPE